MAKKVSKKKKGPKGKRNRDAAKLERRWGEHVDEDEIRKSKIRRGKSRLNSGNSSQNSIAKNPRSTFEDTIFKDEESQHFPISEESDSSDESDENTNGKIRECNVTALPSLLKQINHTFIENDHIESDECGKSEEYVCEKLGLTSTEVGYEKNLRGEKNDSLVPTKKVKISNPYCHFSNPTFVEGNDSLCVDPIPLKQVVNDKLHPNIDVKMSDNLVDSWIEKSSEQANEVTWRELAAASFQHVQKSFVSNWFQLNQNVICDNFTSQYAEKEEHPFSTLQNTLYVPLSHYADIQITCDNSQLRDSVRNLLALHVLNHVLTANTLIYSNNNKINALSNKTVNEKNEKCVNDNDQNECRDQGYTKPKVLILTPTRGTCLTFVNKMLSLLEDCSEITQLDRFRSEFGIDDSDIIKNDDKETLERRKSVLEAKGDEWVETFGDMVNSDDDFKIGLSLGIFPGKNKKLNKPKGNISLKLFSDFDRSDIVIASPLGLKMCLSNNEEMDGDHDFLSSIEVVMIDYSNVLLMQNWDHVNSILQSINQQPKKSTNIDFSRVRNYLLAGKGANWRQLIVVSPFDDPHILSSFKKNSKSIVGKCKVSRKYPNDKASICNVMVPVRQIFQRIPCSTITTQGHERLKYFTDKVLPQLISVQQKHTLIFIPSYFDFISVRNLLLKRNVSFVSVTEYSRTSEVSRGRARFLQARKQIMLYTGTYIVVTWILVST